MSDPLVLWEATLTDAPEAKLEGWKKWGILSISTGLYSGYFPVAPGTAGSLLAVVLLWFLAPTPLWGLILITLCLLAIGIWACDRSSQVFDKVDAPQIVIDEIVGMFITMIGMPITGSWLLYGFLAFRFFDIVKPPPAKFFDTRIKNGFGVMFDDVIAGIYSNLLLHLVIYTQI